LNVEVPPIELRPFEKEIIDSFKTFAPAEKRGGRATPRKGVWIRGHLLSQPNQEDFAYAMWKRWAQFTRLSDVLTAKIEVGTYGEFTTYLWLLKRLGLTLRVGSRTETRLPQHKFHSKSPALRYQPVYYTVNPAELGSRLWESPWRSYERHMYWARRKFRRPGVKRAKKKRGRPPARPELTEEERRLLERLPGRT